MGLNDLLAEQDIDLIGVDSLSLDDDHSPNELAVIHHKLYRLHGSNNCDFEFSSFLDFVLRHSLATEVTIELLHCHCFSLSQLLRSLDARELAANIMASCVSINLDMVIITSSGKHYCST